MYLYRRETHIMVHTILSWPVTLLILVLSATLSFSPVHHAPSLSHSISCPWRALLSYNVRENIYVLVLGINKQFSIESECYMNKCCKWVSMAKYRIGSRQSRWCTLCAPDTTHTCKKLEIHVALAIWYVVRVWQLVCTRQLINSLPPVKKNR